MTRAPSGLDDQRNPPVKRGWIRRLLPLAIIAALLVLVISQGWHRYLSLEQLAINQKGLEELVANNAIAAICIYMLIYMVVVALSLPGGAPLTIAGGLLFGWFLGGLITVVAATVGAVVIFLIARSSLGEPLAARAGPWLDKFRKGFQENALSYLLFLRLVPAFPFWVVNLAPAFLGVGLRQYVVGTALGIIPGTFAFAFAGEGLDSVLDAQRQAYERCVAARGANGDSCMFQLDTSSLITTELLIAFAALGIVALIPVVLKKLRKTPSNGA